MKPGNFLSQFDERDRSMIANMFYTCCRQWLDGSPSPDELVGAVKARVLTLARDGEPRRRVLEQVFDSLATDDARQFARYVIEREQLPAEERARLKEKQAAEFREAHMASLPVTARQVQFLRSLGCTETPANRAEASKMIGELIGKQRAA